MMNMDSEDGFVICPKPPISSTSNLPENGSESEQTTKKETPSWSNKESSNDKIDESQVNNDDSINYQSPPGHVTETCPNSISDVFGKSFSMQYTPWDQKGIDPVDRHKLSSQLSDTLEPVSSKTEYKYCDGCKRRSQEILSLNKCLHTSMMKQGGCMGRDHDQIIDECDEFFHNHGMGIVDDETAITSQRSEKLCQTFQEVYSRITEEVRKRCFRDLFTPHKDLVKDMDAHINDEVTNCFSRLILAARMKEACPFEMREFIKKKLPEYDEPMTDDFNELEFERRGVELCWKLATYAPPISHSEATMPKYLRGIRHSRSSSISLLHRSAAKQKRPSDGSNILPIFGGCKNCSKTREEIKRLKILLCKSTMKPLVCKESDHKDIIKECDKFFSDHGRHKGNCDSIECKNLLKAFQCVYDHVTEEVQKRCLEALFIPHFAVNKDVPEAMNRDVINNTVTNCFGRLILAAELNDKCPFNEGNLIGLKVDKDLGSEFIQGSVELSWKLATSVPPIIPSTAPTHFNKKFHQMVEIKQIPKNHELRYLTPVLFSNYRGYHVSQKGRVIVKECTESTHPDESKIINSEGLRHNLINWDDAKKIFATDDVVDWSKLGKNLNLTDEQINKIEEDKSWERQRCLKAVVEIWITSGDVTWENLATALERMDCVEHAQRVRTLKDAKTQ